MTDLLLILAFLGGIALMVVRALAVDEVRGRIQRRQWARLEKIIEQMPVELREAWAEEWRGELAAAIAMPLTAAKFIRGVQKSAADLVGEPAAVPSAIDVPRGERDRYRRQVKLKRPRLSATNAVRMARLALILKSRLAIYSVATLNLVVLGVYLNLPLWTLVTGIVILVVFLITMIKLSSKS